MSKHKNRYQTNTEFQDPVCKMKVSLNTAVDETKYQQQTYYFCSNSCRQKFDIEPDKFLQNEKRFRS